MLEHDIDDVLHISVISVTFSKILISENMLLSQKIKPVKLFAQPDQRL